MSEELKPCPFCGSNAYIGRNGDDDETFGWASCDECEADGPHLGFGATPDSIAKAWNIRADVIYADPESK